MKSIVDGLRPDYAERIEIRYIDADTEAGKQLLKQFGMPGHPSSVITGEGETLLWSQVGGMNADQIRAKLEEFAVEEG